MEEEHGQNIPDTLNAEAFIAARLKELTKLTTAIGERNQVSTIFQRLPKHMRRRAMSHSVKRVPRNLRSSHKRQIVLLLYYFFKRGSLPQLMKNNALKKSKKVRKRYRKRPRQLLLEYKRRQKTKTWLETHIWHAKRFRMKTSWNYKIAESSYEKTFKAVYRATTSHCLVQDMSYYCCLELRGCIDRISDTFKLITNTACGLSIRAKCWLEGNREGNIPIFKANSYPYNFIGNVDFIWKPLSNESETRSLWIWCHPAIYEELTREIVEIFAMSSVEMQTDTVQSELHNYISADNGVTMVLLKDQLNRFRLTGPLSNAVLTKALHSAKLYDKVLLKSADDTWWTKLEAETIDTSDSLELLKTYPQPFLFPLHCILGCNIVDPRLFLKKIKSKANLENEGGEYCLSIPPNLVRSSIWQAEVRNEVSSRKVPLAKLNSLRSELLIPGFDEQLLETVNTVIPILLIQRPGTSIPEIRANYGSGWDIILPSNWAMPVWLALILCGARAGGLRETRTINFESHRSLEMSPDSEAGKKYYAELKSQYEDIYFKKPPKKRVNFLKLGMSTPFYHDWELLVGEWCSKSNSFFVLRDKRLLQQIKEYVQNFKSRRSSSPTYSLPSNSLIPVTVTMLGKGQLAQFSHICVPSQSDVTQLVRDKHFTGPFEEPHPDSLKQKRKMLRLVHTKDLKRLRRKRIKEKRERMQAGPPLKITKRKKSPTEEQVQAYLRQMRDLWIPAQVKDLKNSCSREVCGLVVTSGFSFMKSCVLGQGYVVANAFTTLFQTMKKFNLDLVVLTRSPNSLNYRFCKLNIVV